MLKVGFSFVKNMNLLWQNLSNQTLFSKSDRSCYEPIQLSIQILFEEWIIIWFKLNIIMTDFRERIILGIITSTLCTLRSQIPKSMVVQIWVKHSMPFSHHGKPPSHAILRSLFRTNICMYVCGVRSSQISIHCFTSFPFLWRSLSRIYCETPNFRPT